MKGKDKGKPKRMFDADQDQIERKCINIIGLCTVDNIMNNFIDYYFIIDIQEKLEKLCISNKLSNKLLLKRKLQQGAAIWWSI